MDLYGVRNAAYLEPVNIAGLDIQPVLRKMTVTVQNDGGRRPHGLIGLINISRVYDRANAQKIEHCYSKLI